MTRFVAASWLLVVGCSSPAGDPDGAVPPDTKPALTEGGVARCAKPGVWCAPANVCALGPVCSPEGLCLPTLGLRDCDDGLSCTQDRCIQGGCEHVVQPSACLIDEVCHPEGATVTCGRCDPAASATAWTPVSDKPCDDGSLCTKNDRCRQGVCIGEPYTCSDGLACTTDGCNGSGGCYFYLKAGFCMIEKTCYRELETDATGCKVCDPAVSTTGWTTRTDTCKIDGLCYGAGAKDPTGCGECDPLHAPTSWSLPPDRCLVGGECLVGGTPHPSKCALCDPKASGTTWTPVLGAALTSTAFSLGLEGWIVSPPMGGVGWQISSSRFASPPASLYYGNPATKNYDSGGANSGTATAPTVKLAPGQKAYLALRLYVDVDPAATTDALSVRVNSQVVWSKAKLAAADYRRWVSVLVDLASFAGQVVSLQLDFDTKSNQAKGLEGIYIDDVILLWSCGPLS